jgi:hypothetical protein
MSQTIVQTILEQIRQLPQEDRLLLENELAEMAETEWRREAEQARRLACEKGLDQAAINETIERVRYPN